MHIIGVQLELCLGLLRLYGQRPPQPALSGGGCADFARSRRRAPLVRRVPRTSSGGPRGASSARARRRKRRWWPLCGPPVHPPTMAQTVADLDFDPIALLEQELGSNDRSARLRAVKGLPALATACGVEVTRTKILSILAEHVRQEEEDEVQYRIAMARVPRPRTPRHAARRARRPRAPFEPPVDPPPPPRSSSGTSAPCSAGTSTAPCSSTCCRASRASRRPWSAPRPSRRCRRSSRR